MDNNNLAVPQVGRDGGSSRMGASSVTLTCRICDLSTTQAPGIRLRTICPRCGNFYANDQHSEHTRPSAAAGPSISGTAGEASFSGTDANREVRLRNRSNSRRQPSPTPERLPSLEKRVRFGRRLIAYWQNYAWLDCCILYLKIWYDAPDIHSYRTFM